jgi:hypothetical protein
VTGSHSRLAVAQPPTDLSVSLTPQQFHWYARTKDGLRLNKAVLKGVGAVCCDIDLIPLRSSVDCTQVAVTLTGRALTNSGPGRLGIASGLTNTQGLYQGLGQFADFVDVPRAIGGNKTWTSFELKDVVPLFRLGGVESLSKLSLAFLPCPRLESCYGAGKQCSDIEVKDLHVLLRPLPLTDIAAKTLSVY